MHHLRQVAVFYLRILEDFYDVMHLNSVTAINLQAPHARQGANATMLQLQLAVTPDHGKQVRNENTPRCRSITNHKQIWMMCNLYIEYIISIYLVA